MFELAHGTIIYNQTRTSKLSDVETEQNVSNNTTDSYYKNVAKQMMLIVSPILLVIGGIGNPLCIVILLRKRKPNSTIIYLCLLAVFDVLVLYTGLLRLYLKEVANFDIRNLSPLICKFHVITFKKITFVVL